MVGDSLCSIQLHTAYRPKRYIFTHVTEKIKKEARDKLNDLI